MTYPAVVFLILIAWSFFWSQEYVLYLLFGSFAFGSLALVPPALVSGFNLLPAQAVCVVMLMRQILDPQGLNRMARTAFSLQDSGLMTLFWVWSAISALTFAGVFQGQVMVMALRGGLTTLAPTPQNFTTMAYITTSIVLMILLQAQAKDEEYPDTLFRAIIFGGAILALTGIMDVALGAGQKPYFAPFKTAQYVFMDGSEVLGLRRVEGLMTEASAYGPVCVSFATFLILGASACRSDVQCATSQVVGWSLIVLGAMSTSSAAFVGLGVFFALFFFNLALRLLRARRVEDRLLVWDLGLVFAGVVGLSATYMVNPGFFSLPLSFVDAIVFKKSQSSSYADRMSWNMVAINAFNISKGLGVGVGSTRASNWALAVLSNTGIIGAALMFGFYVLQLLKFPKHPGVAGIVRAAKFATLATLSTLLLVGTSPDFGLIQAVFFAVIITNTAHFGRRRVSQPNLRQDDLLAYYRFKSARRIQ